jgi:hypothetical protein
MKQTIFPFLFILTLMSCKKDQEITNASDFTIRYSAISASELPQSITSHVNLSFPSSTIHSAGFNRQKGYQIELSIGWELYYDVHENFFYKSTDNDDDDDIIIDISGLPSSVIAFISTEHPTDSIIWAEIDDNQYEVYLASGLELYFTLDGTYIGTDIDIENVNSSQLPAPIFTYIESTYPGATIVSSELDDNYYEITLSNGTDLYFDLQGNLIGWEAENGSVQGDMLPQSILDYISTNYPAISIVEAEFDDNRYEIELSNGIELYFDANGNFLFSESE